MGDRRIRVNGVNWLNECNSPRADPVGKGTVIATRRAGFVFAWGRWRAVPAGRNRDGVFLASCDPARQSSRTIRPSTRGAISPAAAMASMTCVAMSLPEAPSMSRGAPANMS